MIPQIVVITSKRIKMRAIMERKDFSTDIPTYDYMETSALETFKERFPNIDTDDWSTSYILKNPIKRYEGSWGAVEFDMRA